MVRRGRRELSARVTDLQHSLWSKTFHLAVLERDADDRPVSTARPERSAVLGPAEVPDAAVKNFLDDDERLARLVGPDGQGPVVRPEREDRRDVLSRWLGGGVQDAGVESLTSGRIGSAEHVCASAVKDRRRRNYARQPRWSRRGRRTRRLACSALARSTRR